MEAKDIAQLGVAAAMLLWFAVRYEQRTVELTKQVTELIKQITLLIKEVAEARSDVKEVTGRHEIPPELRKRRSGGD